MIKIAGELRCDEPMAGHTSFRIGGPADLYAVPATAAEAEGIIALCARESVPCFFLGGGTNLLVSDRGIRGVVVDLSRLSGLDAEGALVMAQGGTPVSELSDFALARGLAGLEFAHALPGSVGGAVWMNARCYDCEIADVLAWVDCLDGGRDGRPAARRYLMDRADWDYKRSPFQRDGAVILRAAFRLSPGDPRLMRELMADHRQDREKKGHFLFPCAGSVFKNNRAFGAPTGKLVDSLGLKGRRMGGAQIAPFHGNIIVNTGGASARDVRALVELVEEEVVRSLGFSLEREVILAGDW
jgi:UDP-N-acetylmuramate dehydrogenase